MKRNLAALFAFGVVLAVAGKASAQTSPLVNDTSQTNIQGNFAGQPATNNIGSFEAWAFIASALEFDVTDSTLDCGTVAPGSGGATVACPYDGGNGVGGTAPQASLTVNSNADWALTINDGATFSSAPAAQGITTMSNADAPASGFVIALTATNTVTSSDATGVQPPNPAAVVTITGTYGQSNGPTQDLTLVDQADEYGDYLGEFVVVLHEQ